MGRLGFRIAHRDRQGRLERRKYSRSDKQLKIMVEQRFCFRNGRSLGATVRAASKRKALWGYLKWNEVDWLYTMWEEPPKLRHKESETHSSHPRLRYEVFFFLMFPREALPPPLPATVAITERITISTMVAIVNVRCSGESVFRLSRSISLTCSLVKWTRKKRFSCFVLFFFFLLDATWRLRDLSHSCYYYYNDDVKTQTNALWVFSLDSAFMFRSDLI